MLTAVTRDLLDSRKGRFERCFCRRLFIMMIKAELLRSELWRQVRNIIFCENLSGGKKKEDFFLNFDALR